MRTFAVWRWCDGEGPRKGTYPVALACWSLSLPCFLHPHSRAPMLHRGCAPAPTLQSTHSTQRTWSTTHTPEHPLCTEDMVQHPHSRAPVLTEDVFQCPHPRAPTLHRGRSPMPTPQSAHSAQRTQSNAHTPDHPLCTEDVVQRPHPRSPTLHRGCGPAPTLQSTHFTQRTQSSPGAFWVYFLSCTGAAHTTFPQPLLALLPAHVLSHITLHALKHLPLRQRVSSVLQGLMPALSWGL